MKNYSANWPVTILTAVALHVAGAVGFSFVSPLFESAPKIQTVVEIELVDAELSEEVAVDDAENFSSDDAAQSQSSFRAEDLVVPELNVPAPTIPPIKPVEVKPIERPKPKPPPKVEQPSAPPQKVDPPKDEPPSDDVQRMTKPPVTVSEVQPDKSAVKNFSGYISIAVRIGKDGTVKSTEILQSSGDGAVDEISIAAARQWTFQPALDQIGRPMECDKIITFDLRQRNS